MNSKQFVSKFPKYKWHNGLLAVLDFIDLLKNKKTNEYVFCLVQVAAELNIKVPTFKNYLRRLEKLNIIIWKRYVGQKGDSTVQML